MRWSVLLLLACLAPHISGAGDLATVEIYDRTDGTYLPIHRHRGRLYVAGEPRHQYEIRVRNQGSQRVLAVTSVDGVNVVTGETAAERQSGYVLDGYGSVDIEGWRKSLDEVATFYFTSLGDSYAARTGRPDNVGVIGVALFRERTRCCVPYRTDDAHDRAKAEAPAASSERDAAAPRVEERLGTGHGHREHSSARYVDFQRASATPDETIVIYYDSKRNLVAQGVIPRERPAYAQRGPKPFPGGFVRDP